MRLPVLARRSVAVLAATALVSAGGLVTGAFVGSASAQDVYSVRKANGGPPLVVNNAAETFVISGSAFYPKSQQSVSLRPAFTATGQGDIVGVVADNFSQCAVSKSPVYVTNDNCGNTLTFTADLVIAAPGKYDVVVKQSTPGGADDIDTCFQCVEVLSVGAAVVTDSAKYNVGPAPTDGKLVLTGMNFARGARVDFYRTDASGNPTTPDPGLTFSPVVDSGSGPATGYVDATTLRGVYTAQPGNFTAGRHIIRVTNVDNTPAAGPGAEFIQPRVAATTPPALGQGATAIPVVLSGDGFDASNTVQYTYPTTPADVSVTVASPPSATADRLALTVPTSVTATAPAGLRDITVRGKGGAFTVATGGLAINAGPKFANTNPVTPNNRGQGSTSDVVVNGSGFNAGSVFTFGDGVVATTKPSTTATVAQLSLVVDPEALPGARTVRVTNGDFGTASLANGFTVVAKPIITSATPPSGDRARTVNVRLDGTGFATTGGVSVVVNGGGVTVGPVNVVSSTQLQTTFTVAPDAAFGTRDIAVTNVGNGGTSTCIACFGVNSLAVNPGGSTNSGVKTVTLTGAGLSMATQVVFSLPGNPDYQQPISATTTGYDPNTGALTVTVDMTNVATGSYTVSTNTSGTVLSCTGCFLVTAVASPLVSSLAPATGGQGAVNRSVVIAGSNFSPGETVQFSGTGITVNQVTYNSPTQITALLTIASNAAPGARSVTVTNIGDRRAGSAPNAFTVNVAPVTASLDPSQLGQNAVTDVTLTGTGYAPGAVVDFGQGVSSVIKDIAADGTAIVATVTVADDADTTFTRDVKVTNADGGVGTLAAALGITQAPRITSIAPSTAKAGETKTGVIITGTGFASETTGEGDAAVTTNPQVIIGNVTVTVTDVSADGTAITADLVVAANAAEGPRVATVINPDEGRSTKAGAFAIVIPPPTPPTAVNAGAADGRVSVSFSGADGQGKTITGYKVEPVGDSSKAVVVPGSQTFAVVAGLTNGTPYQFEVAATSDPLPAAGDPDNRVFGSFSSPSNAVTPKFATQLTSSRSPVTGTAGSAVTYTGTLRHTSGGAPVAGAPVAVTLTPDIGASRNVTVNTNSNGVWLYRFAPTYNTTVRVRFAGDADESAVNAAAYRMGVAPRFTRTSPASGASTLASTVLAIRGYLTPNKASRTVVVYNGGTGVGHAVVAGNGTFTVNTKLPRGTYTLRIAIGATPGNIGASSATFVVRRT